MMRSPLTMGLQVAQGPARANDGHGKGKASDDASKENKGHGVKLQGVDSGSVLRILSTLPAVVNGPPETMH